MATESPFSGLPVPQNASLLDKNGNVSLPWLRFFMSITSRTGNLEDVQTQYSVGLESEAIMDRLRAAEDRIADLSSSLAASDQQVRDLSSLVDYLAASPGDEQIDVEASTNLPVGAIQPYGGATAPIGWLSCDGSAVSRATYHSLFSVIGTAFGAGDGSTTFNLPDGRDRAFFGAGSTLTLGATGGAASVNLAHTHDQGTLANSTAGAHTHDTTVTGETVQSGTGSTVGADGTYASTSNGDHTHVITGSTGSALTSTSILPPYFVGNWIIKYQ